MCDHTVHRDCYIYVYFPHFYTLNLKGELNTKMPMLLIWLTLIYLSGLLGVFSFTRRLRSVLSYAAAIPVGLVLYVLIFRIANGFCSPWVVAGLTLLFAVSMIVVGRYVIKYNPAATAFGMIKLSRTDYLAGLVIFAVIVIHSLGFVGHDEINHFFFASQITEGKFPPSAYGFPSLPVKYHYGWDILLASGLLVSGLAYPVVSDILTAYNLLGALLLTFCILKYLQIPAGLRILSGAGFFVGDGILGVITYFVGGYYKKYLTLMLLYHQHSWTFAVGLFLVSLVLLAYGATSRKRDFLFIMAWLVILYLGIPVCSGIMIPVVGLVLASLALKCHCPSERGKEKFVRYVAVIVTGILLFAMWPYIGGIMVAGDAYDRPAMCLALSLFGISRYLKYEIAYVLMMPVGFCVFCTAIYYILKRRMSVLSEDIVQIMLWLCVLVLVPFPMILLVENAAYWDNFCKFNFVGVLAAWLLLPIVIQRYRKLEMTGSIRLLSRIIIDLILSSCFLTATFTLSTTLKRVFVYGPRKYVVASSRQFTQTVADKRSLVDCVSRLVGLDSNIVIVNRRLKSMYPISRTTNKPQVDGDYIEEYYEDFRVIPQVTGRSIINFYDYNLLNARDAEYAIVDAMDRVFSGYSDALNQLNASYVLCSHKDMPDYLIDWEKKGEVELVASSVSEGWYLYKNTSNRLSGTDIPE